MNGTQEFDYTGKIVQANIKKNGYYRIELWGARGGNGTNSAQGGKGAYTKGTVSFSTGNTLYINVGQMGNDAKLSATTRWGGWNGGGGTTTYYSSEADHVPQQECAINQGTGGGATDIRSIKGNMIDDGSYTYNSYYSRYISDDGLRSRFMVAAGGGGGGDDSSKIGGYGGALTGCNGVSGHTGSITLGGQQTAGGTFTGGCNGNNYGQISSSGKFGVGGSGGWCAWGGGGGGWYGGASGGCGTGSGSGGSSYISGHLGSVAVTSLTDTSPKCSSGTSIACSVSPTGYQFVEGTTQMIAGNASMPNPRGSGNITGNNGNGYARITYLGTSI